MRLPTLTAATALLLATLACGGQPPEPQFERSEHRSMRDPSPDFAHMDLPYFGARIERSGPGYMQVSYGDEATVEQLVEWWPSAMEAEGWVPRATGRNPDGGFSGSYTAPDGRSATLSVSPEGTLWMVDLTLDRPISD